MTAPRLTASLWLAAWGLASALGLAGCGRTQPVADEPAVVATVHQYGPVGYRDPVGVIDPTGTRLATAANHRLTVRSLSGDPPIDLVAGNARILHLAWHPSGALLVEQRDGGTGWWLYPAGSTTRSPYWDKDRVLRADSASVRADALKDLSWSFDGKLLAGIERNQAGSKLWITDSAGSTVSARSASAQLSFPAWLPDGRVVCLALADGRQRITLPCGGPPIPSLETQDAYGPVAVTPDGKMIAFASPNDRGFVEMWVGPIEGVGARRLAAFPRDAYAPSVARNGTILFKVQDYSTAVAVMPSGGGPITLRTAFQAETPSWNWTGTHLGITYGSWRRVTDDFRYPDIAQDAGIIAAAGPAPATQPETVVQASVSEDQGLTWSPNGKWIAFHSHQQESDDVWLRPAATDTPLTRISRLGRGAEVGWPRWSADGRWILFDGDANGRSAPWIIGVDQERGRVRVPARRVRLDGISDDVVHAEWLGGSDEIIFSAFRAPENHALYRVSRLGGEPTLIHEYSSTQRYDGFGVNADGSWVIFPAPDTAGVLQLHRLPTSGGGRAEALTTDAGNKTQPAVSPDGRSVAFTQWRYSATFYTLKPIGVTP